MAKRPNILWYSTDQQRFDTISALGNSHINTPTLDSLVANGTAFTRAYCQSPICTPSRSSFLTGMYPSRIHNTRNGNESFPEWPPLVTKMISDSGYECGMIGKFHLQSSGKRIEPRVDDGYSYWKFSHAPRDDWKEGHDYADWVKHNGESLDDLRLSKSGIPIKLHQTKWASDMAIDFITQKRSQPWMLNINVYDPHPPFIPAREYTDLYNPKDMPGPYFRESDLEQQEQLARIDFQGEVKRPEERDIKRIQAFYYAMISQVDDQLARIIDKLNEIGQLENTLIVFTTDHGETLGDHGLLEKGCRFYEGLTRVPLIFSWPAGLKKNIKSNALVELMDIAPTLLEITGIEVPEYMQGKSLMPILTGHSADDKHREFVRCEYFDAIESQLTNEASGPLGRVFTGGREEPDQYKDGIGTFATMFRNEEYKLIIYHGHNTGELYNLKHDPWEFNNLWDDPQHQDIKNNLIQESFDNHVLTTTDVGSRRIAPM